MKKFNISGGAVEKRGKYSTKYMFSKKQHLVNNKNTGPLSYDCPKLLLTHLFPMQGVKKGCNGNEWVNDTRTV